MSKHDNYIRFRLPFRQMFRNSSSYQRNSAPETKIGGCTARLFAQNFDAVPVVIVISAGDAIHICKVTKTQNYTF